MDCIEWSAWYNSMPGADDPKLYVSGTCTVMSSSTTLELIPGDEGIIDEPDLYVLQLIVHEAPIGDDRIAEVTVSWSDDVGPDIRRVRIQGAASAGITVGTAN